MNMLPSLTSVLNVPKTGTELSLYALMDRDEGERHVKISLGQWSAEMMLTWLPESMSIDNFWPKMSAVTVYFGPADSEDCIAEI